MYVTALVIPVPEQNEAAYREWAENSTALFKDYGCLESVAAWEDFVPVGKQTDFRRAVAAEDGEKIVLTWQIWPDKATFDAAEERMHEDARMEPGGEIPFDPRRLILGCFQPIHTWTA